MRIQKLIGFGIPLILITLGFIGYGAYSIYSFFNHSNSEQTNRIPVPIKELKIFKGEEFLTKTEFFKLKKSGFLEIVLKGLSAHDEKEKEQTMSSETAKNYHGFADMRVIGNEIIAVGAFGGYVFDLTGNLKRGFLFEPQHAKMNVLGYEADRYYQALDELQIIETGQDKYAFLTYNSVYGINIYDLNGKTIWKFGNRNSEVLKEKTSAEEEKEVYVTEVTVGDLDDDRIAEYIISQKNDGIRVLDQSEQEKWFQPDEFPTAKFRLVDLEGDGKTELLEFQGKNSTIRDKKTGNVLKKLEIESGIEILPTENAQLKKSLRFFDINKNKLKITDLTNQTILESDAPLSEIESDQPKIDSSYETGSENVYKPKAVWVSFKKDKPKYLAIIASFINISRSNLYVYDEKGTLIYHELLPERAETLTVMPSQNDWKKS